MQGDTIISAEIQFSSEKLFKTTLLDLVMKGLFWPGVDCHNSYPESVEHLVKST